MQRETIKSRKCRDKVKLEIDEVAIFRSHSFLWIKIEWQNSFLRFDFASVFAFFSSIRTYFLHFVRNKNQSKVFLVAVIVCRCLDDVRLSTGDTRNREWGRRIQRETKKPNEIERWSKKKKKKSSGETIARDEAKRITERRDGRGHIRRVHSFSARILSLLFKWSVVYWSMEFVNPIFNRFWCCDSCFVFHFWNCWRVSPTKTIEITNARALSFDLCDLTLSFVEFDMFFAFRSFYCHRRKWKRRTYENNKMKKKKKVKRQKQVYESKNTQKCLPRNSERIYRWQWFKLWFERETLLLDSKRKK